MDWFPVLKLCYGFWLAVYCHHPQKLRRDSIWLPILQDEGNICSCPIQTQMTLSARSVKYSCPVHAMQPYRVRRGIAPHIPNLGTRWRSAINLTSRPQLPLRKNLWCQLNRRPHSWFEHFGEEVSLLSLLWIEPQTVHLTVTVIASLDTVSLSDLWEFLSILWLYFLCLHFMMMKMKINSILLCWRGFTVPGKQHILRQCT
jgi:hypothetical protein